MTDTNAGDRAPSSQHIRRGGPDWDRLIEYTRTVFAPEDGILRTIRESHAGAGLPVIHISPEEGAIIQTLLKLAGAVRVLEVGTLGGYSTVWMARALPPGGELVTVEASPHHAAVARENLEFAGVAGMVRLVIGEALTVLPGLAGPFDAIFLDADKARLPDYLDLSIPLLARRGLLMCDNAFLHGMVLDESTEDPDAGGMREFNRRIAADSRFRTSLIPVRDGLVVAVMEGEPVD